jgi:flagellar hook-basal body complex protein FliE
MKIIIPISVGELLDKITILQIKAEHSSNNFILKELNDLSEIAKKHQVYLSEYLQVLKEVNQKLWKIEDDLREMEKTKDFSQQFIELARSVYQTNDERARIKREINELTHSSYKEIKIHK